MTGSAQLRAAGAEQHRWYAAEHCRHQLRRRCCGGHEHRPASSCSSSRWPSAPDRAFQPVAGFNYGARKYRRVEKGPVSYHVPPASVFERHHCSVLVSTRKPSSSLFRDDPRSDRRGPPRLPVSVLFACFLQPVIVAGNICSEHRQNPAGHLPACCRQGVFFIPLILTLPRMFGLLGGDLSAHRRRADLCCHASLPLPCFLHPTRQMEEAETAKA